MRAIAVARRRAARAAARAGSARRRSAAARLREHRRTCASADRVGPGERPARIVDAVAHREVDVARARDALRSPRRPPRWPASRPCASRPARRRRRGATPRCRAACSAPTAAGVRRHRCTCPRARPRAACRLRSRARGRTRRRRALPVAARDRRRRAPVARHQQRVVDHEVRGRDRGVRLDLHHVEPGGREPFAQRRHQARPSPATRTRDGRGCGASVAGAASPRRARSRRSRARSCGRGTPPRPAPAAAIDGVKRGSWKYASHTLFVTARLTSRPIRSMSSNGPMRKPPASRMHGVERRRRRRRARRAVAALRRRTGRAQRLTMKPGVDFACTGTLPHAAAVA